MALKTIVFLMAFAFACGGALYAPLVGVIAYVMHYQIGPERQWWAEGISHWGVRYSFALAAFTAVGVVINYRRLRYGKRILTSHEWILVIFVGLIWLSTVLGLPSQRDYHPTDYPPLKLTKILIFALMLTHVVTNVRRLNVLFWAFVVGAIFLGYQAHTAPSWMFRTGRVNAIGGPDFREANGLGAYLVACLPIIAVQFIRTDWKGKLVCLVAGPLAINGIVLSRSRGAMVALAGAGMVALAVAPKKHRKLICAGLIVVAVGGYALTDPGFWERSRTMSAAEDERDTSAQGRIDVWRGSLEMLRDYPLGVGAGNFGSVIGEYVPVYEGRDAHSTYVRCYGELGIQGIAVYLIMLGSAVSVIVKARRRCGALPRLQRDRLDWLGYGILVSLSAFMFAGITMTSLYLEGLYWFLALPVCLSRAVANASTEKGPASGTRPAG